jgi:hypothetical protein
MRIITENQHRALSFVEACNGSGYSPRKSEVELWLKEPVPASDLGRTFGTLTASLFDGMFGTRSNILDHMVGLHWIIESPLLTITQLGRALLGAANRAEVVEGEAGIVVLDRKDPFSYARLIGHLARAKEGLLVDPYFRIDQLMTVLNSTSIARILVSKQHKSSKADIAALAIALDSPSLPRDIQIRATSDQSLHDRLIVGEDGEVWTLGASLNSVATTSTVIVPVPQVGAEALRQQAEEFWAGAAQVRTAQPTPDGAVGSAEA